MINDSQYKYILKRFSSYFKKIFDSELKSICYLKQGSSNRKLYRLKSSSGSCIGVNNKNINENIAFISFAKSFYEHNFRVPKIYYFSRDKYIYLMEDLGNETLQNRLEKLNFDYLKSEILYKKCLNNLINFQLEGYKFIDFNLCYQTKILGRNQFEYDLDKFYVYFFKKFVKPKKSFDFDNIKTVILKELELNDNKYFVYRDFQPRNIMLKNKNLYFIDFQSGRKGPLYYDIASFIYSSSIKLSEKNQKCLLDMYSDLLGKKININEKQFRKNFYYFSLIRLLQVVGSYCYVFDKRQDKEMLEKIPTALMNLKRIYKHIYHKKILKFLDILLEKKFDRKLFIS